MAFLSTRIKRLSIAVGLYRPARRLSKFIRRKEQQGFEEDVALYRSLLPQGALCFDVGANIGEKSEALLHAGTRVVAFEPNRLVIPELRARCGKHASWTLVETALGSGSHISIMHAHRSHGQSSLTKGWGDDKVIATFPVPIVTLDAAIACFGLPDYCKIDVEGWEMDVLSGLKQPIPLISFEFHLDEKGILDATSCLRRLAEFGPSQMNVTAAEGSTFLFNQWVWLEDFLKEFPENLNRALPGNRYGDIFVRFADPARD